jgi:hypothetical protein
VILLATISSLCFATLVMLRRAQWQQCARLFKHTALLITLGCNGLVRCSPISFNQFVHANGAIKFFEAQRFWYNFLFGGLILEAPRGILGFTMVLLG